MLIKPASSLCNLRCRYCFYHEEARNREVASHGIMSRETAMQLIDRAYADATGHVSFAFQGGEPTLAGLDFFESFTDVDLIWTNYTVNLLFLLLMANSRIDFKE